MCDSCDVLTRLNERYRETIELLTRERDELRALEGFLAGMVVEAMIEPDLPKPPA